ncbi:hypothetical protein WJX73_009777 [Symbiochloris irregularis]|uniref:Phospholipid:diacylglycerol acyltransferase n=1 Tax=Symbiochloris irregularis TaxID=706552 RepID=A0AAW1P1S7_9CHLO
MKKPSPLFTTLAAIVAIAAAAFTFRDQVPAVQKQASEWGIPINLPDWFKPSTQFGARRGDSNKPVRVGVLMKNEGLKPKYPVVIVPGFVTSGLQLWQGHNCSASFYRRRIWGSLEMGRTALRDLDCWLTHMRLDPKTGEDPEGIKLRALEGLEAIEWFMPGYAVWAKMTEGLSDIGYDPNMLETETFDWRLAVPKMQQRDKWFTRLKLRIENLRQLNEKKVAVLSHSWGDNVFRNFLVWVEGEVDGWTEKHVHTYVNIGGPTLGVPKSMSTYLSGETRDTAELGAIGNMLSNQVVPSHKRTWLFRTWGAGIGMLPNGGPRIWGNATWAPDDTDEMREHNHTFGAFMIENQLNKTMLAEKEAIRSPLWRAIFPWRHTAASLTDRVVKNHDIDAAMELVLANAGHDFRQHVKQWGAVHADPESRQCHVDAEKYFFDPLKCPLPKAPSLSLFCLYGIGVPTERSYYYNHRGTANATEGDPTNSHELWWIDVDAKEHDKNSTLEDGVRKCDGDATVPLISSGTLCRKHWRHKTLNPSGFRVVSREYPNKGKPGQRYEGTSKDAVSADHVGILSNEALIEDVLRIVSGHGDELQDDILSDIDKIVANIPLEQT